MNRKSIGRFISSECITECLKDPKYDKKAVSKITFDGINVYAVGHQPTYRSNYQGNLVFIIYVKISNGLH